MLCQFDDNDLRSRHLEIRNTATKSELEWLDTKELIVQLMTALRNVAVYEGYSPSPSDRMVKSIELVQRIDGILRSRRANPAAELGQLTKDTGWLMELLFEECLKWPDVEPRTRELDGVLRFQRCELCRKRDFPLGAHSRACDECLCQLIDMLGKRRPLPGVILFRTYNESHRCAHADSETVLMAWDDEYFLADSRCNQCLQEEYDQRQFAGGLKP